MHRRYGCRRRRSRARGVVAGFCRGAGYADKNITRSRSSARQLHVVDLKINMGRTGVPRPGRYYGHELLGFPTCCGSTTYGPDHAGVRLYARKGRRTRPPGRGVLGPDPEAKFSRLAVAPGAALGEVGPRVARENRSPARRLDVQSFERAAGVVGQG